MKIIWHLMDHHGAPYDFIDGKPPVKEGSPGITLVAQQWGHVADMVRMLRHGGIIVISGLGESLRTVADLVNVECVETMAVA